jgi:hypothetical protein
MKVLVCGGRDYSDYARLRSILNELHEAKSITRVIHGAANGADMLAGVWASARNIACSTYPADWGRHGRAAGAIRNSQMLAASRPDLVVAFPGGRGTADMVAKARVARVRIIVVPQE